MTLTAVRDSVGGAFGVVPGLYSTTRRYCTLRSGNSLEVRTMSPCRGVRPRVRAGDARRERERFLGAGHYVRTPERRGYANGTKPKRIDTPAGTANVQVPKTAGHNREPCLTAIARARAALGPRCHAGGRRDVHQGRVDPRG